MACRCLWKAGLLCSALALGACEDDPAMLDGGDPDSGAEDSGADASSSDAGGGGATREVEVSFEARVGSLPFACDRTYSELGTSKVTVALRDFRLYLYDVRLVDADDREVALELTQDGKFQYEDVALLDFEDRTGTCQNGTAETNMAVKGKAPAGTYKGLRFGVGMPSALNHGNPAEQSSPLNLSALSWAWQQGHQFVRIDARVQADAGAGPSFVVHLGSAGCEGDPRAGEQVTCAHPNRAAIDLSGFDPETNKVVLDYAELVAGVALDQNQGTGETGCASSPDDPDCESIFRKLGLDAETGAPGGDTQTVFSVEPK
jgi:uncharacterized repeat protein (TIGR04052 family)